MESQILYKPKRLSSRQLQVLSLLHSSNKEIGKRLGIKVRTVDRYAEIIRIKLNVNTRFEALLLAAQKGIISLPKVEEPTYERF